MPEALSSQQGLLGVGALSQTEDSARRALHAAQARLKNHPFSGDP